VNPALYPAPVVLTEADIDAVLAGALVTKVVYLENPYRAPPLALAPGEALETTVPPRCELDRSREFGRPVLVLRVGQRQVSNEELAHEGGPGTVLFPGEPALPAPWGPPQLPFVCWQWYDPILGPRGPDGECLCDGGDQGIKAGIGPDGRLAGVDP